MSETNIDPTDLEPIVLQSMRENWPGGAPRMHLSAVAWNVANDVLNHLALVQPAATGDGELLLAARRHVAAVRHHWPETCKISDTYRRLEEAVLIAGNPRPAAEREGEVMAVLRELLESMDHVIASRNEVDPAPANQRLDSAIRRARTFLPATTAPQPATTKDKP